MATPQLFLIISSTSGLSMAHSYQSGAGVLGIALAVPECHQKLLAVVRPGIALGQGDHQQLTGKRKGVG